MEQHDGGVVRTALPQILPVCVDKLRRAATKPIEAASSELRRSSAELGRWVGRTRKQRLGMDPTAYVRDLYLPGARAAW